MNFASFRKIQRASGRRDFKLCKVLAGHPIIHSPRRPERRTLRVLALPMLFAFLGGSLRAETGHEAWLRYAPLAPAEKQRYQQIPENIVRLNDSPVMNSARQELIRGLTAMLGGNFRISDKTPYSSIFLGTIPPMAKLVPDLPRASHLQGDGFWLKSHSIAGVKCILILGGSDRGVLYGVFALLGKIARGENVAKLNEVQHPSAKIRWVDQWDNLDGSIERGYAGRSVFFDGGNVRADLTRASEYAR